MEDLYYGNGMEKTCHLIANISTSDTVFDRNRARVKYWPLKELIHGILATFKITFKLKKT